jgi:hypothetical protein
MSSSMKTIGRITQLAPALAALALLGAAMSGAQDAPQPEVTPAAQMARHFQHEDALYAAKPTSGQTRTPAEAMALHFQHEDALHRARQEILGSSTGPSRADMIRGGALDRRYGNVWTRVSPAEFRTLVSAFGAEVTTTMTPQQARAELVRGPGLNRLAKQYEATAAPASSTGAADGFDWGDAGVGVGAAFGAMLLAAAGAIALRKRGRIVLHS